MPLLAPAPDPELSSAAAIVGVGESNYGADYAAARDRSRTIEPSSLESLYRTAFQRALADAGVQRSDVDGVIGSVSYGALGADTVAKSLDLEPRFLAEGIGMMLGVVPAAVAALTARRCDVVALVYGALSRGTGREFGGQTYTGNGRDSYYYYHPWRWSSQAAHWAMMFQHYAAAFGVTEASLGSVATTLRAHAARNTNAIMRSPMTVEDYLETRYIVRPLRLFDLCLVNDGAVCLIMCRSDRAAYGPHAAVHVSGWADVEVASDKMRRLVVGGLRARRSTWPASTAAPSTTSRAMTRRASTSCASSRGTASPRRGWASASSRTGRRPSAGSSR